MCFLWCCIPEARFKYIICAERQSGIKGVKGGWVRFPPPLFLFLVLDLSERNILKDALLTKEYSLLIQHFWPSRKTILPSSTKILPSPTVFWPSSTVFWPSSTCDFVTILNYTAFLPSSTTFWPCCTAFGTSSLAWYIDY